jgi:hypothetical protein
MTTILTVMPAKAGIRVNDYDFDRHAREGGHPGSSIQPVRPPHPCGLLRECDNFEEFQNLPFLQGS